MKIYSVFVRAYTSKISMDYVSAYCVESKQDAIDQALAEVKEEMAKLDAFEYEADVYVNDATDRCVELVDELR